MTTAGLNASERPLRVLVIDDDEGVRATLRMIFEDHGFDVVTACDGKEGLGLFETCPVDLVITDLRMPGKSGEETIGALRQRHPAIGIIASSGGGQEGGIGILSLAREWGADEVIQKPFEFDELLALVWKLLPDGYDPRRGDPEPSVNVGGR